MIGILLVAHIALVARAPDTATACLPFELTVAVRSAGAVAPRVELQDIASLQLLRASVASRTDTDAGGRVMTLTEGSFLVATRTTGRLATPSIVATSGDTSVRTAPSIIDVRPAVSSPPLVLVRSRLDAGQARRADTLFVGQQVDYVVDVQLNESARQRLRHNPTFFPPEMPAVLAYDLAPPAPASRQAVQCFETLSYRRALFPLFTGQTKIPPATLAYSLPLSSSFFSREESFELRTDSVRFVAIEPPMRGRPPDFAGAVGRLNAEARLDGTAGRMGDPVVLTLRLTGTGNVKLLPRPALALDWATVAPGEERVSIDTSAARVRGTKEFDWLLTPRRAGRLGVPVIRYPYFDPERGLYEVAVTAAAGFDVAPATLASADTGTVSRLPIRRTLRDEVPYPLPTRGWYWVVLLLAPVPAALRRLLARRTHRAAELGARRRLRSLGMARRPPSPRALRRAYLDAIRERVPTVDARLATHVPLERLLRRAGVTGPTAHAAEQVLGLLDRAAFSPSGVVETQLVSRALAIAAAVDAEAVRPGVARGVVATALLGAALLALPALGMPVAVVRTFDQGVRAYERGELAVAQRLFARSASRAPRAADAWANLGIAAWARGDTAHAAFGWQRALRLEPQDGESRDRLAAIQPPLVSAPAFVPPVPVNALALVAVVLWMGAWLALAAQALLRTPYLRPIAGGVLVLAVASLAGALELHDRSRVRGLGVLRVARELLEAPSPGAAPLASAAAGEVGALGAREGAWVRVTLDGARAGWLPVATILPLDGAGVD